MEHNSNQPDHTNILTILSGYMFAVCMWVSHQSVDRLQHHISWGLGICFVLVGIFVNAKKVFDTIDYLKKKFKK